MAVPGGRVPVFDDDAGDPAGQPSVSDLGWLRDELAAVRSKMEGIEEGLASQRSAFIDIAGARTIELRDALSEVRGVAAALQEETARLRDLQDAVAERLHDVVIEIIRPQLQEAVSGQFPRVVMEALAPSLRQALADWLPAFVVEAIRPEVRQSLDERLPAVVAEALSPEIRRTLADRLPNLVIDSVRPELRQSLAERLPAIVGQVVTPEVGAVLANRLPSLVAEAVNPEMSVTLAEIEGCAAELRNEAAKMRALREVVAERLPEAAMTVVEPHLREALVDRLPSQLSAALAPAVQAGLAGHLPALMAEALSPELREAVVAQVPELVARSVDPELRSALARAVADELPAMVGEAVQPEVRAALEGSIPSLVADALVDRLAGAVVAELPAAITHAVGPDVSESLADIESLAAALRNETSQFRNLRESIAQRMPQALVSSVQPVFEDLLGVRLPAMMSETLAPALDEALMELIATRVAERLAQDGVQAQPAAARIDAALQPIREEAVRLRELRDELAHDLPALVAGAVRDELARLPPPAPPAPPGPETRSEAGAAGATGAVTPPPVTTPAEPGAGRGDGAGAAAPEGPRGGPEPAVPAEPPAPERREAPPAPSDDDDEAAEATETLQITLLLPGLAIGPTLASHVSAALSRARVRRRRRRPAGPPGPGLHRYDPHVSYALRTVERFALARRDGHPAVEAVPGEAQIGTVAAGERLGAEVQLPLGSGGFSVTGPRARDTARAVVLSLLAANDADAARAIVVGELLPPSPAMPGLTRSRELGTVLDDIETEASHRRALLARAGASDLASYRVRKPDDPLPFLLVVTGDLQPDHAARLEEVLGDGAETGIAVLLVDTALDGLTELRLTPETTVASVIPESESGDLVGAHLFTVEREPAAELLGLLADARTDVEDETAPPPPDVPFQLREVEAPIIDVRLFGAFRLEAGGREVRSGLRAKARELLAFYLLHPEGTGLEEATEALWPEADPRRGSEWFWTALGNLRSRLRKATGESDLKVIEREDDRYCVEPVFSVDLWRFEAALAETAARSGDPSWATALEEAVALCPSELLATADWAWAEIPRDDLRSRLVDLLVSLAATRLVNGDVKGALQALQQAVDTDPLAEQLYRRIMRLHAKMNHPDEVESTFRSLQARLAEVGLEPTLESEKLRQELV